MNRPYVINKKKKKKKKKKRTCRTVDFAFAADHRLILNQSEEKDKYFDLAMELKKLLNMKVMDITLVVGSLSTVIKCLVKS